MIKKFEITKQQLLIQAESSISFILSFFQLGVLRQDPLLLKTGLANINFLVTTSAGSYVIKVLLTEQFENLKNEILIQQQLTKVGIMCPKYIENEDETYVFKDKNIVAVVSNLIPGVQNNNITKHFCFNIGKILSKFHKSVSILDHPHCGWLNPKSIDERLGQFDVVNRNLASSLLSLKINGQLAIFGKGLPEGAIHGDLYEGNVLVNKENTDTISAIFDFEHSEHNLFIIDLARTILSVAEDKGGKRLDYNLMKNTIDGYNSIRQLQESENICIPDAIKYVAGIGGLWLILHDEITLAKKYLSKANSI